MSRHYRAQDGTDAPGVVSLIFGCLAVFCLLMGFFTCGATYYAAVPFALIGGLVGFFGRGNMRVAGLLLNFLALIPAIIVLVFFLGVLGLGVSSGALKIDTTSDRSEKPGERKKENPTADAKSWVDEEIGRRQKTVKREHAAKQRIDNDDPSSKNHATSKNGEWIDASKPVRQGDVEVAINYVVTDIVGEFGDDAMLLISLSIKNISDNKKIDYESWSKCETSHIATLADNFGNKYRRIDFGLGTRILSHEVASERGVIAAGRYILLRGGGSWWPLNESAINPGESVTEDILAFQKPVENIDYLRLELPASAFGETGSVRVQIPQEMIDKWPAKRIQAKREQEQMEAQRRVESRFGKQRRPPMPQKLPEAKQNPKSDKEREADAAAVKLKIAKSLQSDSLSVDGKERERLERAYIDTLREIVKKYPMTKAGNEAKELLDKGGK